MKKLPRIVVAGQVPPPVGGQNAMVAKLLQSLRESHQAQIEHLSFCFTPDTQSARKGRCGKLVELARVVVRLLRLRWSGTIDLIVFPAGGPQPIPLFRDLLLLPWILLLCQKTVLHFHAAGIAEALETGNPLARAVAFLYRRCDAAVVMTDFNRRDPLTCGLEPIFVVPHHLTDEFDLQMVNRPEPTIETRILAMGHLCEDKGTRRLIQAFAKVSEDHPELILELAGEPLAPYDFETLNRDISETSGGGRIRLLGVLAGAEKRQAFGRAHLFIFPSVAPYESFGLVLVEALMWGLPVLASKWRGNSDVLGDAATDSLFDPPNSTPALEESLRRMLDRRHEWLRLGAASRNRFLKHYHHPSSPDPMTRIILSIASPDLK